MSDSKSRVALIRCATYSDNEVLDAMRRGVELLGGAHMFAKAGEKIVLKPNVLYGTDPQKCVTTHPSVLKAVGKLLKEAGINVYYGDSSGFGSCEANMKRAKLKQAADEIGIELVDFDKGKNVSHKDALLVKSFVIANGVLDSDGIVSLSKLKTHGLTRFTGAVKNQFGCIPGLRKAQYHVKLADPYDFATMLIDLNTAIKPRLFIMDGIMAMEGNGPRSGNPRKLSVLLISSDPVALDATACRIINLDPEVEPTSAPGERAGLGTYHLENIEIVGESIDTFIDKDFEVNRAPPEHCSTGRLKVFVKNRVCDRPAIEKAKCTNCGTCVQMCPVDPKAVDWHMGNYSMPPTYKYDRCIRCYCCQEMCPDGAIYIRNTMIGRILSRL